jgi:hypothetical protein
MITTETIGVLNKVTILICWSLSQNLANKLHLFEIAIGICFNNILQECQKFRQC